MRGKELVGIDFSDAVCDCFNVVQGAEIARCCIATMHPDNIVNVFISIAEKIAISTKLVQSGCLHFLTPTRIATVKANISRRQ